MIDVFSDKLTALVHELFDVEVKVNVSRTDPENGDFSTNVAMQLASTLGKNPREIAEQLATELQKIEEVDKCSVAGPGFINITVKSSLIAGYLHETIHDSGLDSYGTSTVGDKKTVVCEFPSPNMAKPFSVGHMRPALQGWAISQLMRRMGYKVITDNHLGDSGTPFGKWVVGFIKYSSDDELAANGISELSRIYIAINTDLKNESDAGLNELADEVQAWLKKLEAGDKEAIDYSNKFNKISLDHMHQAMERLKISTEYELGESKFVARGHELVDELLAKGIAEESEGAVIVRLDEYGIDTPIMLRKANGAALYATTDLATIEFRQKEWGPVKVFIHTGQEQAFYFKQLKALAIKCGFKDTIEHLWHGLIDQTNDDGTRTKMSSRKGVVLLNDLLDFAEKKASDNLENKEKDDVQAVSLAAIKFLDFTADRKNGVLFDWESMFSVHGFSGPAVQYAAVRVSSILSKSGNQIITVNENYDWVEEHALLLKVAQYPNILREAHDNYEMHKLASYLYELARELNRYYENTTVLNAEDDVRSSRLWLLQVVYHVLTDGLEILGIPTPKAM